MPLTPEKAQQVQENQDMLSGKRKAESADLIETIKKIKDKLREAGHSEELKKDSAIMKERRKGREERQLSRGTDPLVPSTASAPGAGQGGRKK